jgi:hypothetical protein
MADPRAENCRGYRLEDGHVTGVALDYVPVPQGRFELKSATLIDNRFSGDNTMATVAVYDKGGLPCEAPVVLAWPWTNSLPVANRLLPGNPNRPVQHVIWNGYDAAAGHKGPLAIYVANQDGTADSDVCGGLGLPNNQHVCYSLVFQERGAGTPTEPTPGETSGAIADLLLEIRELLREGFRL